MINYRTLPEIIDLLNSTTNIKVTEGLAPTPIDVYNYKFIGFSILEEEYKTLDTNTLLIDKIVQYCKDKLLSSIEIFTVYDEVSYFDMDNDYRLTRLVVIFIKDIN